MEKTPIFQVSPFGNYFLLERIAVGGMAEIFKAKQVGVRGFEKIVVIKKILHHLSEDPEFVEMFEDEAKIAAQLTQANVVQIYELGEIDGTLYITMEYVEGKNLRDVTRAAMSRGLHLSVDQSVGITLEILKGLDYAHRKTDSSGTPLSIVHRDMSPQNVIVSYEGEVKILDFGIAKAASKISKTEVGVLKGKFSYMSPEQASGKLITQTSDIYACGVMFHELLTSERLFRAKTDMETLDRVKQGIVPTPSEKNPLVPKELDEIVLKALAKDQRKRYQTASEMVNDLNRFCVKHKVAHSSQELSAFMRTLFAQSIHDEKERLLRALAQIPSLPNAQAQAEIQNAKTHITFKRGEGVKSEDKTLTGRKKALVKKSSSLRLRGLLLLFAFSASLYYFREPLREYVATTMTTANPKSEVSLPLPTLPPTAEPAPAKGQTVDQILKPVVEDEDASPEPSVAPRPTASPKPAPKKVLKSSKVATPHKTKKQIRLPVLKKMQTGKIDIIAPLDGFAQLFIDDLPRGTVPGPNARGMSLDEGIHHIRCETAAHVYTGKIRVRAKEHLTVSCQELKTN